MILGWSYRLGWRRGVELGRWYKLVTVVNESKVIHGVLDPVPGVAASPVRRIKYLSTAFATRQALAAQPEVPGAWALATDAPSQSVPKAAGVSLHSSNMPSCGAASAPRERTAWWWWWCEDADVLLEAKSGVGECSRTHPCPEKLLTINESHTEFLG